MVALAVVLSFSPRNLAELRTFLIGQKSWKEETENTGVDILTKRTWREIAESYIELDTLEVPFLLVVEADHQHLETTVRDMVNTSNHDVTRLNELNKNER